MSRAAAPSAGSSRTDQPNWTLEKRGTRAMRRTTGVWSAVVIAAFALSGVVSCAPAPTTAPAAVAKPRPTSPEPDQVGMAVSGGGLPGSEWTIRPDGSGLISGFNWSDNDDRPMRRLPPAPGRYRQIVALLRPAERYAGRKIPCVMEYPSAPNVRITWRRSGVVSTLDIQFGCRSAEADKVYDPMVEAGHLVGKWDFEANSDTAAESQAAKAPVPRGSPPRRDR